MATCKITSASLSQTVGRRPTFSVTWKESLKKGKICASKVSCTETHVASDEKKLSLMPELLCGGVDWGVAYMGQRCDQSLQYSDMTFRNDPILLDGSLLSPKDWSLTESRSLFLCTLRYTVCGRHSFHRWISKSWTLDSVHSWTLFTVNCDVSVVVSDMGNMGNRPGRYFSRDGRRPLCIVAQRWKQNRMKKSLNWYWLNLFQL